MSKWAPPNSLSDPRVIKRAASMPDIIDFVDENGKPHKDPMEPLEFDEHEKLLLAFQMVRSKQSLETVIMRGLRAGVRKAMKEYPEAFEDLR